MAFNLKLKGAESAAEEGSPLPPLSVANLAQWLVLQVLKVFAVSATFTGHLLSWCMNWSQKNVLMLWSNSTRLLTTWFLKDIEIRDKAACVNLPPDIQIRDKVDCRMLPPDIQIGDKVDCRKLPPDIQIRDKVDCRKLPPCIKIRKKPDWGNLLPELCNEIGIRLTNRLDILRFRAVCKKWRSSLPLPSRFPLRVPPPPNCDPEFCNMPYFIIEVGIATVGVGYDSFEEVDRDGKCRAHFLFPGAFKYSHDLMSQMVSYKNPNARLSFVSKAYHLRMAHKTRIRGEWNLMYNKFAEKMVIISSNLADGVNLCYAQVSDLSVVAHLSWGVLKGRLALLRLGGSSKNWEWDTSFCTRVFDDISTYRGRLCAVDSRGTVFLMDYHSLHMTQIAPHSSFPHDLENKELFEAFGDLYLADTLDKRSEDIKMYKLLVRRKKWVKVMRIWKPMPALLAYQILSNGRRGH